MAKKKIQKKSASQQKSAPKKKAASKKKAAKGKRYSDAQKSKIVNFVEKINMEKGRGGVAQAVRKFGVSALTISNWIKSGGASKGSSAPAGKRKGSRGSSGREGVLAELVTVQKQISKQKAELEKLEARFETLKGSL